VLECLSICEYGFEHLVVLVVVVVGGNC
jgi:hypothetical protein